MLSQRIPPASCTGAPLQAWRLSRALAGLGLEVEVTTTLPFGISAAAPPGDDIPVQHLSYPELPGLAAMARFARGARLSFPASRWDVVHGHALSPMILGAALAKDEDSAPFLVKPSIGGQHSEGEIQRICDSPAFPIFRKALHKIEMFAVLDDLVEQDLASVGIPAQRMRRVDNGIDLQAYYPATAASKADLRLKFKLSGEANVLLFCGQLTSRKGVEELLAAWNTEFAHAHNAVLAICGDGPLREEVERTCARSRGSVVYFGPVADSSEYIRMADILVLPSRCESFGNVVIEALASGVPVASTACGIAPRVLADGRCGWLIADTSKEAIESTLHAAFSVKVSWEKMATEGRRVAEAFSFERVAENYTRLYLELVADSRAGF